eukprot:4975565-Pyramimonas_sp.AAC.1
MANMCTELWILPRTASVVREGFEAGQGYHQAVKEAGKGHELGPPPRAHSGGGGRVDARRVRGRGDRGRSQESTRVLDGSS